METYINFTVKHVFSIEKTDEPDTYWVLFNRLDDISIYGPCITEADKMFRRAVKTCIEARGHSYGIRMRIAFDGLAFDEFMDNVLNTGRVDGVLTINEVNGIHTVDKFEITRVNPRTAFTINRVVEIRKAKKRKPDTDAQQKVCQVMVEEALKDAMMSLTPDSIKKVIYNDPATIIFWSDGTKTIVKCMEDEEYDPEKGFMAAVTKKVFGDKYGWVMRHQVKPAMEHEKKVDALMESISDTLHRKRTAQESAVCIRDQMMLSGATPWELETFDRFVRKYIADKEKK